jgi:O-antigen ligase
VKFLLSLLIIILVASQTFSIDASLAPGLSVKNAFLYVIAAGLVLRIVVSGQFKTSLVGLQMSFVFLVAYAIVSWLIALLVIQYPGYELVNSIIQLKVDFIDHAIFLIVFFYGVQSVKDSLAVADVLVACAVVANAITTLDASGVLGLNIIPVRTENIYEIGRVQGAFGEANQHAAMVVMLLPAMVAKVLSGRGVMRLFWASGVLFSLSALLMTVSRGAMVGLLLACIWAAFVFRRFLSLGRFAGWFGAAVAVITVVVLTLSTTYLELLQERLMGLSFDSDATEASSGRTLIWSTALRVMMDSPWTFLTGFGFNVYSTMGFEYAPHNAYLGLLFNLGLPGLVAFLLIIVQAAFAARSAAEIATPAVRAYLIAYVVGFLALCVTIFFVELHEPWLYVWAYTGLMMRVVVCAREEKAAAPRAAPAAATPAIRPRLGRQSVGSNH